MILNYYFINKKIKELTDFFFNLTYFFITINVVFRRYGCLSRHPAFVKQRN